MKLMEKMAKEWSGGQYDEDAWLKGFMAARDMACLKAKDLAAHAGAVFNAEDILKIGEDEIE